MGDARWVGLVLPGTPEYERRKGVCMACPLRETKRYPLAREQTYEACTLCGCPIAGRIVTTCPKGKF